MHWNIVITSDAISLQVNPLQCAYLSELDREGGEAVISEIDARQMLHFSHGVRQFGENIALQVQFCKVFQDADKSQGHLAAPYSQHAMKTFFQHLWGERCTTTQLFLL